MPEPLFIGPAKEPEKPIPYSQIQQLVKERWETATVRFDTGLEIPLRWSFNFEGGSVDCRLHGSSLAIESNIVEKVAEIVIWYCSLEHHEQLYIYNANHYNDAKPVDAHTTIQDVVSWIESH